jgi:methenyltetrahydromethanopterin cyclohydrolase
MKALSLNALAGALVDRMIEDAVQLRIGITRGASDETLIDCGASHAGGIEAGLRLAAICMGGLGDVTLAPSSTTPRWPWHVVVRTSESVTACLASQYAGWSLTDEGDKFSALGSGPARALARKEPIFAELRHSESADRAVLVLETDRPPPRPIVEKVVADCGVHPHRLAILYAPTGSLAGSVQIAARVVEVALHKAHTLKFPLDRIVDAAGSAPLSPPHPDFTIGMGRTNDSIIFGGRVQLFVSGPEADASDLAEKLPSSASRDYGAPFAEIFRRNNGDFYVIDPMLFSPAEVIVTALETGASFRAGRIDLDLLDASFG